jgi:CMP-N-acetylneuraminic acid synthetase
MLHIVPMRGGSKSIPDKNIMPHRGKPIFYWTLKHLPPTSTVVITDKYADEVKELFPEVAVVGRRPEVSRDDSKTEDTILRYLEDFPCKHEWLTLVQVTNPYLNPAYLKAAQMLAVSSGKSVVSVVDNVGSGHFVTFDRTVKSAKKVYRLAGSFWICKKETFLKEKTFVSKQTLPFVVDKIEII